MNNSIQIVCPFCDALNRTLASRINDNPKCGKCRKPLFTGKPAELTAANFDIHTSLNDIPVLIDFWAPWCGPCRMMAPQFEQAAAQLEPEFRLAKVNTEAEQMLGAKYNIRGIPTMAMFLKGKEINRQSGAIQSADIVRWAKKNN
ncbi:MAG: thioredoxin TrxC [Spirochaetes bacterium]|nr:thioredoxin TrxC [Spirochaetota bacterium]